MLAFYADRAAKEGAPGGPSGAVVVVQRTAALLGEWTLHPPQLLSPGDGLVTSTIAKLCPRTRHFAPLEP